MKGHSNSIAGCKVAAVIPPPIKGSGGIATIFNRLRALHRAGAEVDLYMKCKTELSLEELIYTTRAYYGDHPFGIHPDPKIKEPYDVLIATSWDSALIVREYEARYKVYYLQDYEGMFNPMSDAFLTAEESYQFGFNHISIGNWLAAKLSSEFGVPCRTTPFSADREIYRPLEADRQLAVCSIHQPDKLRRCPKLVYRALGIVKAKLPETSIIFYGSDIEPQVWYDHTNLGLQSVEGCNDLYNRCQVGLCISPTNPSRIPFEMMAAGLPVVDLYRDSTLYDIPEAGALLAHASAESIAEAVLLLLDDATLRESLSTGGMEFMQDYGSAAEDAAFVDAFAAVISGQPAPRKVYFKKQYQRTPVVAPIYQNAHTHFHCAFQAGRTLEPDESSENVTAATIPGERTLLSNGTGALFKSAEATTAQPEEVRYICFRHLAEGGVLTHPHDRGLSAAKIPAAFAAGSTSLEVTVVLDHAQAAPTNCAIGLLPAGNGFDATLEDCLEDLVAGASGTGWIELAAQETVTLKIDLREPYAHDCDVHLIAKPAGAGTNFAACKWIDIQVY